LILMTTLISWKLAGQLVAAISVLTVGAWFGVPLFHQRMEPLLHPQEDVSTQARFTMWQAAWHTFQANPILGCGPRNFGKVDVGLPGVELHGETYLVHGHSNYLHILATTGIVGFTVFIWLLFASVRLAWLQARAQRVRQVLTGRALAFKRSIGLALFGALISLAVAGIFEYNFGTGSVRLAEWFVLAMLVPVHAPLQSMAKPVPEKSARPKTERKRKAA
jgi:O-antigen ligase